MHKRNITSFAFVVSFFVIPIVAAWWFFNHADHTNLKTINHGILIQPPLPIHTLALTVKDTTLNTMNAFDTQTWQKNWVLVYVNPKASCFQDCQQVMYYMRQVRIAAGKNQDMILRSYVTVDQDPLPSMQRLLKYDFRGTQVLLTSKTQLQQFLKAQAFSTEVQRDGQLFVVDPNGWVMMRYPVNFPAKNLLDDLTRLLQVN